MIDYCCKCGSTNVIIHSVESERSYCQSCGNAQLAQDLRERDSWGRARKLSTKTKLSTKRK